MLDYEGLKGRLLSSSYIPVEGKLHENMIDELKKIFGKYNSDGVVKIDYETLIYAGSLK